MSHFTVMVFGDNPEELLAPYDENERVEEYESEIVDENALKRFQEYYVTENPEYANLSIPELYEKVGEDWNGGAWRFEGDKVIEYSTYNPNSKWDWYQLGGRWTGYFKLKEGANGERGSVGLGAVVAPEDRADSLRKSEIDIEGMRKESEDAAADLYDKARPLVDEFGEGFIPWSKIIEGENLKDIDEKRVFYHNQPLVQAFRERTEEFGHFVDIESFFVSREKYLEDARNGAICPFAFVTPEGEWVEKGKMGWWACVSNEKDQGDWNKQFSDYFDSLPDDTMIHLVDCHI